MSNMDFYIWPDQEKISNVLVNIHVFIWFSFLYDIFSKRIKNFSKHHQNRTNSDNGHVLSLNSYEKKEVLLST